MAYVALPAFRAPSAIDFTPLGEAFDTVGATLERNRLLREQRELGASLQQAQQTETGGNPYQAQPTNRLLSPAQGSAAAAGRVNPADFIKREEGFAPQAKWDVRQNSGGYGSRAAPGEKFTAEKADAYLQRDMQPTEAWISKNVPNATPEQRTALHSFGYNLGTGALDNLKPQIQAGDWQGVAQRMQLYNKARVGQGGALQPLNGLTARRGREAALLTSGAAPEARQGSGINYASGIQTALRQGNVAQAMQLQNAQQEAENTTYTRQRQGVQDQQAAETHELSTQSARETLQDKFINRVAGVAQTIGREADPAKKAQMWQRFVSTDPRIAAGIQKYGVDVNDPDAGVRAIIAEAQGLTGKKYEFTKYGVGDPSTGEISPYPPGSQAANAENELGLAPVYYEDEVTKEPRIGQMSKSGGPLRPVQTPGRVLPQISFQNTGTAITGMDTRTGARVSNTPIDIAGREAAEKVGAAQGEALVDLPRQVANAEDSLKVIGQLRNHPGRVFGTGGSAIVPGIPGTHQRDFLAVLDQAKGKAFLEAFNSLKGGGQITEAEGAKAQAAIARLDRNQSEQGFLNALTDLEAVVNNGLARARQKAGGSTEAPKADPLGIR